MGRATLAQRRPDFNEAAQGKFVAAVFFGYKPPVGTGCLDGLHDRIDGFAISFRLCRMLA